MCRDAAALESSSDWMTVWCPDQAQIRGKGALADQIYNRWAYIMRLLEDFYRAADDVFHKFGCPVYVFIGTGESQSRTAAEERSKKENRREKASAEATLPTAADISAVTYADFLKWSDWTSCDCEFFEVSASHSEIWCHLDADTKLWQTFLSFTGITPDLLK